MTASASRAKCLDRRRGKTRMRRLADARVSRPADGIRGAIAGRRGNGRAYAASRVAPGPKA
jgi:hypothetical protein